MPRLKFKVEDTPNPNAKKFTANRVLNAGRLRSYQSAEAAAAAKDEVAMRLFEIEHVTGVLIVADFCSVNKSPQGQWRTLTPQIKRVLERGMG